MKAQSSQKFLVLSFVLGAIFTSQQILANETNKISNSSWKSQSETTALDESFRLTLGLGSPRRFATRFLKADRTFQIRIYPATSKEMSDSQFYDTRYIKRVLIEEQNGEVTLSLQLKNSRMGWLATTQDSPWRIALDFWTLDSKKTPTLEESWNWQNSENSQNSKQPVDLSSEDTQNQDKTENSFRPEIEIQDQNTSNKIGNVSKETESSGLKSRLDNSSTFLDSTVFVPLERTSQASPKKIQQLQEKVGQQSGTEKEFEVLRQLGSENYKQGQFLTALQIFRKISVTDDRKFKESDTTLWHAGESAFLSGKYESSRDYLRALTFLHGQSPFASQAKVRLLDLDLVKSAKETNLFKISDEKKEKYTEIANSASSTSVAQIAASVRITLESIEEKPEAAKLFQQNFNTCVTFVQIPIATQKSCAYILTRSAIEERDLLNADKSILAYKSRFPDDSKIPSMEKKVQSRIEQLLKETIKSYKWDTWISLERSARKDLLNFSLANPDYTMARATSFAEVGDRKIATTLFNVALSNLPDNAKRNEAASELANLAQLDKDPKKVLLNLNKIRKSESRKTEGLNSKSIATLRTLAMSPINNSLALETLLDEMKFGRYSENELSALIQFAKAVRRKPSAETIAQKILQYPTKSQVEVEGMQNSLLQYASDLGEQNRLQKSAEIYLAVANIAQGNKKAEAAYKAGVSFARAGLFEKAKESWQSAASDLNDKRYSALANERLDRLR